MVVYPKQVTWKPSTSPHAEPSPRRTQRDLVAASLLSVPVPHEAWDERTRTTYRADRAA